MLCWTGARGGDRGRPGLGRRQVGCALLESLSRLGRQPIGVGGGWVELGQQAGDAGHGLELPGDEHHPQLLLQGGDVMAAAGFAQPGSYIPVLRLGVGDGPVMRDRAGPVLLLFGLAALRVRAASRASW